MSTKLAIIDVDGVLVNTEARFERARAAKTAVFQQHIAESDPDAVKAITRQAETEFWRVAFTPGLLELDRPVAGTDEALDQITRAGYHIVLLSSRVEALREATMEWFWTHQRGVYDRLEYGRYLFLKPSAFQFVKTVTWKAGMVQMMAAMYGVEAVLFVDDDEENRAAIEQYAGTYPAVKTAESLDAAVDLLYPHRKGEKQG